MANQRIYRIVKIGYTKVNPVANDAIIPLELENIDDGTDKRLYSYATTFGNAGAIYSMATNPAIMPYVRVELVTNQATQEDVGYLYLPSVSQSSMPGVPELDIADRYAPTEPTEPTTED